ncbi:MAG: hypothetical protein J6S85_04695 [Methanobrevibacter sp.]|nr:hypothetical protein [Methanobrevibacter sp.]
MEMFNGWSNYSTWLVVLWLENDENNYRLLKHLVNGTGINPSKKLTNLNPIELKEKLRTSFYYGDDPINWNAVNTDEIKEMLLDEYIEESEM